MAKSVKRELTWLEINPDTLSQEASSAYKAYKAQYAKANELKAAFQAILIKQAGLPATHTLRFGYNFGKLSIATDVADGPKVSAKAVDFATLIKKVA